MSTWIRFSFSPNHGIAGVEGETSACCIEASGESMSALTVQTQLFGACHIIWHGTVGVMVLASGIMEHA